MGQAPASRAPARAGRGLAGEGKWEAGWIWAHPHPSPSSSWFCFPRLPLPLGLLLSSLSSQAPWKTRKWRKHRLGSPRDTASSPGMGAWLGGRCPVPALPQVWRGKLELGGAYLEPGQEQPVSQNPERLQMLHAPQVSPKETPRVWHTSTLRTVLGSVTICYPAQAGGDSERDSSSTCQTLW